MEQLEFIISLRRMETPQEALARCLAAHDWYHSASEDKDVFWRGSREADQIARLMMSLGPVGRQMYIDACPWFDSDGKIILNRTHYHTSPLQSLRTSYLETCLPLHKIPIR